MVYWKGFWVTHPGLLHLWESQAFVDLLYQRQPYLHFVYVVWEVQEPLIRYKCRNMYSTF